MRKTDLIWMILILLVIVFAVACSSGANNGFANVDDAVQAGVAATLTKDAWLQGVESARQTAIANENQSQASGEQDPQTETPEPEVAPTLKPVVEHLKTPYKIAEKVDTFLTDFNSIETGEEGFTYGDQYKANIYERPFTAENMEYRGTIDIIRAELKAGETWINVTIFLAEDLPESGGMKYGLEIDLDGNGRGDYLIQTWLPRDPEWSVSGVQVYTDTDGDVGGEYGMYMDTPNQSLTGYETMIFDSGNGDDSDLAWVRRNPDKSNSIQIAFKFDLIGPTGYMWSVWADDGFKSPAFFDYHDRFSPEAAGSPYLDSPFYPIKALYLVDTTCRSYYGFTPTGNEPGICP